MAVKIVKAGNRRFKLMPFGPSAGGKTTLAATAQDHPDLSPVLFIDSDDGLLSIAARGDIAAEECKSIEDYERILSRVAAGDPVYKDFKTIITDSGSDMLERALREEAALQYDKAQKASRGDRKESYRQSQDELFVRDYGTVTTRMKRLFDLACSLPKHTIITSLAETHYPRIKNSKGEDVAGPEPDSIHPAFTAKLGRSMLALMDFVWYCYRREETGEDGKPKQDFCILTQEHGIFKAKTRGVKFPAALGRLVVNKKLPEIYDLLLQTEGGAA